MAIKASEISELIKSRIQNFTAATEARSVGSVVTVTDGICRVHGLQDAMQGEMLEFPKNTFGLALNLERDSLAAESGLRPGDVIMEVNKQKIRSAREFTDLSRKATGPLLLRVWSRTGSRYIVIEQPKRQR